jgi:hypothetical protein
VTAHLNEWSKLHSERIVGQVGGAFAYGRDHLLETVGRATQQAVDSCDPSAEAAETARALQMAVAQTAAVKLGAVGLGALLDHLLTSVALDVTGILAAGVVAALGLFVVPARRENAKRELRAKIAAMREQLVKVLTTQFERELERSLRQVDEASPRTRALSAPSWSTSAVTWSAWGQRPSRSRKGNDCRCKRTAIASWRAGWMRSPTAFRPRGAA